ncbi:MAG: hypothetical protein PHW10_01115 [Candidatus Peribacteraceae bacterium]|nr:hypothetical protein [Candidatus Peribacteraceae bacterium]
MQSLYQAVRPFLRYVFYPNPGDAAYGDGWVIALFILAGALVVASFVLRRWRTSLQNPVTRKLSRSWSGASLWFGLVAAVLTVSRTEQIQFFAMRLLWGLWILSLLLYVFFQLRQFRARHYSMLPRERTMDPLERYLPGKRRH